MTSEAEAFDVGGQLPTDTNLVDQLRENAREVDALSERIATAEEELEGLKARRHHLVTGPMPDLMVQLGMDSFSLAEGCEGKPVGFKLGSYFRATWPKGTEARAKAVEWLEANKGAGIIKTVLTARFGREEHHLAETARNRLDGLTEDVGVEASVHPATLTKFVRERIENGEPVDLDILNASTGRMVKIDNRKRAK